MHFGYARVSTRSQDPTAQVDALKAAGCERIFIDYASGRLEHRAELDKLAGSLRRGDMVTVTKLSRLGRSLKHLISFVDMLREWDVQFRSLSEGIDTSTAGGRLTFHVFGALAEFERELIVDNTVAGLEAARRQGRTGGRRAALNRAQREEAVRMVHDEGRTAAEVARLFGVHRSTVSRLVTQAAAARAQRGPGSPDRPASSTPRA